MVPEKTQLSLTARLSDITPKRDWKSLRLISDGLRRFNGCYNHSETKGGAVNAYGI